MQKEPSNLCFIPENCDYFLFCKQLAAQCPKDVYFMFGHYLYGYLRDQGIARWNLKTGKCDFVRLPLFMLPFDQRILKSHWFSFNWSDIWFYWNRNYPDYLLIACPKFVICSRSTRHKQTNLDCYYYVFVDFAKRDFSIIAFVSTSGFDAWKDKISDYEDFVEEVFGSASSEPQFSSKIKCYWNIPDLLKERVACWWEDYLAGEEFWLHVYAYSRSGAIVKRMILHFPTLSYREEVVGKLRGWSPTTAEFRRGIRLSYDRLFFFDPWKSKSRKYPLLLLDGQSIKPNIPFWLRGKLHLYGFSMESATVYFCNRKNSDQFLFSDVYMIDIESIYADPENFICNLQPTCLVPPIKLDHAEKSDCLYILSSKYWLQLYSLDLNDISFRWAYNLGRIKELREPVDLIL